MRERFFNELLNTDSPSGYEKGCTDVFANYLSNYAKHEFTDQVGNVAFSVGDGNIKLMLSAHVDEIALQVQNIDEKGFVHFIIDGGIDQKAIICQTVKILTKQGSVFGVIGKKPIHVEESKERDEVTKIKDMKVDIGVDSREEALKLVSIGDPIVFIKQPQRIGPSRVVSKAIDDKVGLFVVAEVLKALSKLQDEKLKNLKVYGVACTQEETSASGAVGAAVKIDPQYSIDYDVTFATDDEYVSANEWGDVKLGKGGCIAHGVDSNKAMTDLMREVCQKYDIKYQEFSVGSGCTNTVFIKQSSTNAQTLLLSIPSRNMHTPVEMCDYTDLQSLISMTLHFIYELDDRLGKKE